MAEIRYWTLWPVRVGIRWLVSAVGRIPRTTFGEVAEMSPGPCHRCVGRAVAPVTPESFDV